MEVARREARQIRPRELLLLTLGVTLIRHQDSGLVFNVAGEISDTRHAYRMFTHACMNLSWGQVAVAHNPPSPTFILELPTLFDECIRFRLKGAVASLMGSLEYFRSLPTMKRHAESVLTNHAHCPQPKVHSY